MTIDELLNTQLRSMAHFFYALKDPLRLRILVALAQSGGMTVTEMVRLVHVSQPLASWHLARLRTAGLVHVKRDGRVARYSVNLEMIEQQLKDFEILLSDK